MCQSLRAAAARPAQEPPPSLSHQDRVSRCGLRRRGPRPGRLTRNVAASVSVVAGCGGAARRAQRRRPQWYPRVSRCGLRRRGPQDLRGREAEAARVSRCGLRRRGPLRGLNAPFDGGSVSRCGLRRRGPPTAPGRLGSCRCVSVVAGCGGAARLGTGFTAGVPIRCQSLRAAAARPAPAAHPAS